MLMLNGNGNLGVFYEMYNILSQCIRIVEAHFESIEVAIEGRNRHVVFLIDEDNFRK